MDVDIFSTNAGYRGLGFGNLWSGSDSTFLGLKNLSEIYNKPNFIGEIGWSQVNGTQTANPTNAGWFNLKWRDLIQKGDPGHCIGGAFFEYSDEIYSKALDQQTMGIVTPALSYLTLFSCVNAPTANQCLIPANAQITNSSIDRCNTINNAPTVPFSGNTQCDIALRAGGNACLQAIQNWRCTTDCGGCPNPIGYNGTAQPIACMPLCDAVRSACSAASGVQYCLDWLQCTNSGSCLSTVNHFDVTIQQTTQATTQQTTAQTTQATTQATQQTTQATTQQTNQATTAQTTQPSNQDTTINPSNSETTSPSTRTTANSVVSTSANPQTTNSNGGATTEVQDSSISSVKPIILIGVIALLWTL